MTEAGRPPLLTSCSKCPATAVEQVRYSGQHLCAAHFCAFVEARVKRDIRKQGPYPPGSRIAVALSGGKDSCVTLQLLKEAFRENPRISIEAILVDEGIVGYRDGTIPLAQELCDRLGVPLHIAAYKDAVGLTMDELVARKPGSMPCTYCGVLRRRALNATAKRIGATHLATGHNLDDTAQTILMNQLRGDVERLARLGPHKRVQPGLVPRLMPLRSIPEREVALYAHLTGLPVHHGDCPHSSDATRGKYRDLLLRLEEDEPGTRHALIAGYDRMAAALADSFEPAQLGACGSCGEPTARGRCKACLLLDEVLALPAQDPGPEGAGVDAGIK